MADAAAAPALGTVGVDCVRNDNIPPVSFHFRSLAFTSPRSLSVEFVAGVRRQSEKSVELARSRSVETRSVLSPAAENRCAARYTARRQRRVLFERVKCVDDDVSAYERPSHVLFVNRHANTSIAFVTYQRRVVEVSGLSRSSCCHRRRRRRPIGVTTERQVSPRRRRYHARQPISDRRRHLWSSPPTTPPPPLHCCVFTGLWLCDSPALIAAIGSDQFFNL